MDRKQPKLPLAPLAKWIVCALLVGIAAAIAWWPHRPVKVELLPFSDSPPAWDGSYPFLSISPDPSHPLKFNGTLLRIHPTIRHERPVNQFDVDLHSGRFILRQTDLFVADVVPLTLTRTYVVWDHHSRAFGVGGNHPYDICPTGTRRPYTYMDLNLEDDYQVHMPRISKGTDFADAVFRHSGTSSEFFGAQVRWNGNGWTMSFPDGRLIYFPESYYAKNLAQGAAIEMVDAQGNRIHLNRGKERNLDQLISPAGHTIKFTYDAADRITEAEDDAGHLRKYSYDERGHVEVVSDGSKVVYRFEYAPLLRQAGFDPWLLTRVLDGDWNVLLRNKYQWGRVSEQILPDGQTYRYEYQLNGSEVLHTTVTLPSGEKKEFDFTNGIPAEEKR